MAQNLGLRASYIPVRVVTSRGASVPYLDYLGASYLDSLQDLDLETLYIVEGHFEGHPELISNKFYGTTEYWWVICRVNNVIDPILDIVGGTRLKIPRLSSIEQALTKADTASAVGTVVILD